ncbi:TlpA disulfide reductase family protein [Pedobacter deserti]|uniref:TlpA disulfide reductase family protein n=1 Tax=Pedobacter deserti TaxID=2817382 RepID=UPI002108EB87|nr:TlpA disulfide reductase family protein [Pedobacter sp. SYSU D00382]
MKKTILSIVMAALCLFLGVKGQNAAVEPKPIRIGEVIPPVIWNAPFNTVGAEGIDSTLKLSDYADKLIILDFWATYCKPCIASLDYLYSIQDQFKGRVVVIPVQVYNNADGAIPFMKKKGWTWRSITADTTLNKVMLAHYLTGFGSAWIKEGRLLAVPSKRYLHADTISKILKGSPVAFENRTAYRKTNQTN